MLGISIYPEKASKKEIIDYLSLAASLGYKRVFTCLLSVNDTKENIKKDFVEIIGHARSLDMEVILDVAPSVFSELEISYSDLSFFSELGATGIRLDESFNGATEAEMSFNPYDLDIEINMSQNVPYLELIKAYEPKPGKIIGCHNFYPQKYTGLGLDYFIECSKRFADNKVRSACFIDAKSATDGPWPVSEGLCTLEMHRSIDSAAQIKHLYALNIVDDIIIAAQFASKEELEKIANVDPQIITLKVNLSDDTTDLEKVIMFDEFHYNRGDINEFYHRSTQSRVKFANDLIPPHDVNHIIPRGSIVIVNEKSARYKGELHIIKEEIVDENLSRNIVAKVNDEEMMLIDFIKPWQKFKLEV